jgi:rfaE bifunctional protein kinase chain/domain/rfaE bifunctional protein nucleotidyltransferase chain/domain
MTDPESKILTLRDVVELRDRLRQGGKRLVQCHGCFDVVHPGHIRYLKFAKTLGDVLLVSVSADEVVDKGHDRPYIPEDLRMENLAALEFVDFVCLSEGTWAGPILEAVQPDVFVKGREYENQDDPRFAREKSLVERYGGKVVFGSGDVVFSSTEIIRRQGETIGLYQHQIEAFCRRHSVSFRSLETLIAEFSDLRILVLGDPILDRYVFCESASVAQETPIISVSQVEDVDFVGGAATIASQMAAMGAKVTLVTVESDDPLFARYSAILEDRGVRLEAVQADGRPLFVKTRYLVEEQKLLKVNQGPSTPISTQATESLITLLRDEMDDHDALVATDFGYGLFGPRLSGELSHLSGEKGRPFFADVSTSGQANLMKFSRPALVTPTETELRFALADMESGLVVVAKQYLDRSGAGEVVVTLGRRGCVSFARPGGGETRLRAAFLPALGDLTVDPVGAGDLFLSGVVLSKLSGATTPVATYVGSSLATVGVTRLGNVVSDLPRLLAFLRGRRELAL